jgi:hypothetical protein
MTNEGRRRLSGASLGLLALCAVLAAGSALAAPWAAPGRSLAVNLLTGALLGTGLVACMQVVSDLAGRDPLTSLRAGVIGTFARMALAGLSLWAAATRPWFDPIPFVAMFGIVYFTLGIALVMRQRPGSALPAGGAR